MEYEKKNPRLSYLIRGYWNAHKLDVYTALAFVCVVAPVVMRLSK